MQKSDDSTPKSKKHRKKSMKTSKLYQQMNNFTSEKISFLKGCKMCFQSLQNNHMTKKIFEKTGPLLCIDSRLEKERREPAS